MYKDEKLWDSILEVLIDFKEEFGRFPKSTENHKSIQIGRWLSRQKVSFNKGALPKNRIDKLESIGFSFDKKSDLDKKRWDSNFEVLEEYYNKFNSLPGQHVVYKGVTIGRWLANQKQRYLVDKLTDERIEKLESVGYEFINIYTTLWDSRFELLKEFKEEFGRLPKSKETYKGVKIGYWTSNQRKAYINKAKFSKEKIRKLKSIGVIVHSTVAKKEQWEYRFNLVKEFKKEFNKLPKRNEMYKGINVGYWINTQKRFMNKGKLSADRTEKLKSIGVKLSNDFIDQWNSNFDLLKEFKEEFGRFPTVREIYKGIKIG